MVRPLSNLESTQGEGAMAASLMTTKRSSSANPVTTKSGIHSIEIRLIEGVALFFVSTTDASLLEIIGFKGPSATIKIASIIMLTLLLVQIYWKTIRGNPHAAKGIVVWFTLLVYFPVIVFANVWALVLMWTG